jgi:hypothetical protein
MGVEQSGQTKWNKTLVLRKAKQSYQIQVLSLGLITYF